MTAKIIGSKNGLRGFQVKNTASFYGVPVDSGIYYSEEWDMWMTKNITMTSTTVETIEIGDGLTRYEGKPDINKNDSEFLNLVDKIVERRQPNEINRAASLLNKFGNVRYQKMANEQNHHKKQSYPKYILPYYIRAIELNSTIDMTETKKRVKEIEKEIA